MKGFDKIKTLQLVLLLIATVTALLAVFKDADLYALIAADPSARLISIILWLTLGMSFLFLLYDFGSFAQMRRENLQLDRAMYSDALTGVANRYSIDAYIGQFHGKPLPQDMGVITLQLTSLGEINERLGHSAGDLQIRAFAGLLQQASSGACFIGRNGGNKFVVLLRDCTSSRIGKFLEELERLTENHNREKTDSRIRYITGTAFDEGGKAADVNALVALSDHRAQQEIQGE